MKKKLDELTHLSQMHFLDLSLIPNMIIDMLSNSELPLLQQVMHTKMQPVESKLSSEIMKLVNILLISLKIMTTSIGLTQLIQMSKIEKWLSVKH